MSLCVHFTLIELVQWSFRHNLFYFRFNNWSITTFWVAQCKALIFYLALKNIFQVFIRSFRVTVSSRNIYVVFQEQCYATLILQCRILLVCSHLPLQVLLSQTDLPISFIFTSCKYFFNFLWQKRVTFYNLKSYACYLQEYFLHICFIIWDLKKLGQIGVRNHCREM